LSYSDNGHFLRKKQILCHCILNGSLNALRLPYKGEGEKNGFAEKMAKKKNGEAQEAQTPESRPPQEHQ
jgi:hypothetical protein